MREWEDELERYRERESVHIRPLFTAITAFLLFPGARESPTKSDLLKRIELARTFKVKPP